MTDCSKLKKLIAKKGEYERRSERLKKNLSDLGVERRQFVEETAVANTSKKETVYSRRNRGLIKRLDNLETDLKRAEESLGFVNDSILEESTEIKKVVESELQNESLREEAVYESENEAILEMKKEVQKRSDALAELHSQARRARGIHHGFEKHWTAEKIAEVVDDPAKYLAELNPTFARVLGISEEYQKAHEAQRIKDEKEMKEVREKEEERIKHLNKLKERAERALETGDGIPDVLRNAYTTKNLTKNVLVSYWMKEGVASV
jgi:hypothetical protein